MEPVSYIFRHKNEPFNLVKSIRSMIENGPLIEGDEVIVCDDDSELPHRMMVHEALRELRKIPGSCGVRSDCSAEVWPICSEFCLPTPQTGPQAMCDLGAHFARNEWLCFLDSHMSFAPGWRDFPVDKVPAATERMMSPPWNYVDHRTWSIPDTGAIYAGTRWHWNVPRRGSLSLFNFDHVPTAEANPPPPLIPMSGCYFIHRDLYRRIGGFKGLPANHGMEFILAFKAWMHTGKPPATLWTLPVGHVNQGRRQTVQGIHDGLLNGARTLAILESWEAAREWVKSWPDSFARDKVLDDIKADRPSLAALGWEFREHAMHTFEEACEFFATGHPREIHDAANRVMETTPGIRTYQVRGEQVIETTGGEG